jgi:hypothetical protein
MLPTSKYKFRDELRLCGQASKINLILSEYNLMTVTMMTAKYIGVGVNGVTS